MDTPIRVKAKKERVEEMHPVTLSSLPRHSQEYLHEYSRYRHLQRLMKAQKAKLKPLSLAVKTDLSHATKKRVLFDLNAEEAKEIDFAGLRLGRRVRREYFSVKRMFEVLAEVLCEMLPHYRPEAESPLQFAKIAHSKVWARRKITYSDTIEPVVRKTDGRKKLNEEQQQIGVHPFM